MTDPTSGGTASSEPAAPPPDGAGADVVLADAPSVEKGRGQLRQFLETLGGFAPPKPPTEQDDAPAPARSRRWLLISCGILAILCGWLYLPSLRRPLEEMPATLLGAWTTTAPDYADRGFWIGKRKVAFRVGPNPADVIVYPVARITVRRRSGDTTTYDIEYAADGGTNQWSFEYFGSPHPTIVFIHQPEMSWTPAPDRNPPIR